MSNNWPPQFLFTVCQRGAEQALKQEIADGPTKARPAFSRPGFVTFKLESPCERPERFQLLSTFARTSGFCLGKVAGELATEMAREVWTHEALNEVLASVSLSDLHVWQRDFAVPGDHRFEPGPSVFAQEMEQALREQSPIESLQAVPSTPRPPSRRGSWVIDVVLVEPNEWWIGCHRVARKTDSWPGGVPPLVLPEHAVSRAYLKMREALEWSALPTVRGDLFLELGCAPGGAAQALLDRGMAVIGIDPAEMDSEVCANPNFQHVRRRSSEVPRRLLKGVRWLAVDMNVAPTYTLDAVEDIVVNKVESVRGMVLTLKLTDWKLVERIPEYLERIRGWGFRDVRMRQLAFNRQEMCVVALRSRGQRRVRRNSRPCRRTDSAHASKPKGPHFIAHM